MSPRVPRSDHATDHPAPSRHIRTYQGRAGRVRTGQAEAHHRWGPTLGLEVDGQPLDLQDVFGRSAPVALEVGFGMGEATVAMAAAQPDVDLLAVDVHVPGQGSLLRALAEARITHVRVARGDGVVLLRDMLAPGSLDHVRIYYPDPWPKRRHHKRRLVRPEVVDLLADRLASGGYVHVVTDWPHYAEQARALLGRHPCLRLTPHAPWRAVTGYERRGLAAGRPPQEVVATRR